MTPLNDAVGRIVARANAGNYDKVAIIIMTDGGENHSRELTVEGAKKLLDDCRAKGWQVIFLGASYDNVKRTQHRRDGVRQLRRHDVSDGTQARRVRRDRAVDDLHRRGEG